MLSFTFLIANIVVNAWLNEGWAEGNLWLLGNTIVMTPFPQFNQPQAITPSDRTIYAII